MAETVRLACQAMATRFELVLLGDDAVHLRSAGEAAVAEIMRLGSQLSFYDPRSELSRINRLAAGTEPVQLPPYLFELLSEAREVHRLTGGAFDPSVAPLVRVWGFTDGTGSIPGPEDLNRAREVTGMDHVILDSEEMTVQFDREGVLLDLGGIAKGFALDEAARILVDAGVQNALLHGGTSSVVAIGHSYGGSAWEIGIALEGGQSTGSVSLSDCSLSVSAVRGKSFSDGEREYGHVLDARTGRPAFGAKLSAVVAHSATRADAVSTAALVTAKIPDTLNGLCIGVGIQSESGEFRHSGLPGYRSVSI